MGRVPCCEKENVKRGQWTPEEDNKLSSYIAQHGTRNWRLIPKNAGLQRCGKSCRLRWTNYLRPDLKHGEFTESEEQTIVKLHSVVGNRWSLIAAQLRGRTDNDVKNHWNTKLKKKLSGMGIDPVTHKPFSTLMSEIATTLAPPQVAHLTEAALGCFKDEMLHLLTKNRVDFQIQHANAATASRRPSCEEDDMTVEKIKLSVSRAMQQDPNPNMNKPWAMVSVGETSNNNNAFSHAYSDAFPTTSISGFQYVSDGDGSPWNQSACTGSTCPRADQRIKDDGDEAHGGKGIMRKDSSDVFNSEDCVLWDLADDLINTAA
ncbi:hypothetical protein ACHQM5_001999 [Ranunculus cassubicifolius]